MKEVIKIAAFFGLMLLGLPSVVGLVDVWLWFFTGETLTGEYNVFRSLTALYSSLWVVVAAWYWETK